MVFQNYALYPHLSVYDNIAFGLKLRRLPRKEISQRVSQAAHVLGIEGLLDRKPKQLSGGQRQRVAVGRALVRQPAAFLLDEPLSNLDAKLRVQMRKELHELHHRLRATMLYVTHDQVEAMTLGERIVVMHEGLVQQVGTPETVYDNPRNKFVAGFIGAPAMNFFKGKLVRHSEQVSVIAGGVRFPLPARKARLAGELIGRDVELGIRPEDVYLDGGGRAIGAAVSAKATVNVVEPLGHEKIAYLTVAGHEVLGKVDGHQAIDRGDVVEVVLDLRRAHVFDQKDGNNVTVEDGHSMTPRALREPGPDA
jgi:multiple sugar transport system ATP-binding protein